MKAMTLSRCCIYLILCLPLSLFARTWTTADGQAFEGILFKYSNGTVIIKNARGGKVLYAIDKLSEADQSYVREKFPTGDKKETVRRAPPPKKTAPPSASTQPDQKQAQHTANTSRNTRPSAEQLAENAKHFRTHTLNKGDKALPLSGQRIGKPGRVKLSELKGKLVLIHYWSPTNKYAVSHLKYLVDVYKDLNDRGLEIISIYAPDSKSGGVSYRNLTVFQKRYGMTWLTNHDSDSIVSKKWGFKHMPTYVLVDQNGYIANPGFSVFEFGKVIGAYLKP